MEIIKPNALRQGDKILIVTPANSADVISDARINEGAKNLAALGLKIELSYQAKQRYGHTAGTAKQRAKAIMDAFTDDSVKGIMAMFGGFNSNDILEYLDFKTIRKNPKVFIGYSDITVLNNAIYTQAGLVNFNGPAFVSFTQPLRLEYETKMFQDVLMTGLAPYKIKASKQIFDDPEWYKKETIMPLRKNNGWNTLKPGHATGQLIGGNIGTLLALAGTKYFPDLTGKILFVEDDEDENTASTARFFRQLRHMGTYDKIKGLLIGRFPECVGFKPTDSLKMIIDECTEGYDFPILSELDIGHTRPLMTTPIGINVEIDTKSKTVIYLEPAVMR